MPQENIGSRQKKKNYERDLRQQRQNFLTSAKIILSTKGGEYSYKTAVIWLIIKMIQA